MINLFNSNIKFHQCRFDIFDFIKSKSNISKAKAVMTISKGIILYDVSLDLVYFSDGKPFVVNSISKKTLADHDLPSYIPKIMKNNKIEIKFDENDLQNLFNESQIGIVERTSYKDIVTICKTNAIDKIKLIDRVFYTRIEYLGANDEIQSIGHFAKIDEMSNDVYNALYPFKECTLQI